MLSTIFKYAFRNTFRSPIRSLITLASVSLILTLYTVLTSIGNSFTSELEGALSRQQIDIAIQSRYAATPVQSRIPIALSESLAKMSSIQRVDTILIARKRLDQSGSFFVLGVTDYELFADKFGFQIVSGRPITNRLEEIVIGQHMANILKLSPGDELNIGKGFEFKISGIYSGWLNFLNAGLIIDLDIAQKLTGKIDQSSMLFLTLDESHKTSDVVSQINHEYPELRALESAQLPQQLGPIQSIFHFSKIVSLMTLIIATALLINTFVMASNERTKETGLLKTLGWSRCLISSVYFFEALLLCITGGLLGFLLSFPTLNLLRQNFTAIYMYLPEQPEAIALVEIGCITLLVSLVSTLYPLIFTSRLEISTALQHE